MQKIFLCYRRDDASGDTGRLHDRLALEFGDKNIFMDVDSVRLGLNFVKQLTSEVQNCDALLAVIGSNWLDARDEEGNRRIDDKKDFVRIEIGAALKRDIPVIPILLNGTKIPRADRLPPQLQELTLRSALDVRHGSFRSDTDRLIAALKQSPSTEPPSNQRTNPKFEFKATVKEPQPDKKYAPPIELTGTINKKLPDGLKLWLVNEGDALTRKRWPQKEVKVQSDKSWSVEYDPKNFSDNDERTLRIYIVGQSGLALLRLYNHTNKFYKKDLARRHIRRRGRSGIPITDVMNMKPVSPTISFRLSKAPRRRRRVGRS